jgi:hypothetical protein
MEIVVLVFHNFFYQSHQQLLLNDLELFVVLVLLLHQQHFFWLHLDGDLERALAMADSLAVILLELRLWARDLS